MQLWLPMLVMMLYVLSALLFFMAIRPKRLNILYPLICLVFACQTHALLLIQLIYNGSEQIFNLGIFNVLSFLTWMVACSSLLWLWQTKMAMGGVMVCLVSCLLGPLASLFSTSKPLLENLSGGIFYHIGFSIIAWILLTIAFTYCLLYFFLYRRLKQKRLKDINLLSLAHLERAMLTYYLIGWLFLIASLITGFFFVNNLFTQHLWHKTVFTIIAAVVYAYGLYLYFINKRHGKKIIYIACLGYLLLVIGYLISNIIVQFILPHSFIL